MKHVTFHLPSFLRRVRIHGGEFDSSARAMNREEQVRLFQAELRIVRGSTFERKQMSTTIKRIALVAVAALGLGVLSVAPSNATAQMDSFTLSATTGAQETTDTVTATSPKATLAFLASAAGDTMSVTAQLISAPAGNTKLPKFNIVESATGTVTNNTSSAQTSAAVGPISGLTQYVAAQDSGAVSATWNVYMDAPSVVGTYVVRLTPAIVAGGGTAVSVAKDVTITVTQKAADDTTVSASKSTSILNAGETNSATTDATVTYTKTYTTDVAAATIKVTLNNAAGTAQSGESYTATISGPGLLGSGAQGVSSHTIAPSGRTVQVRYNHVVAVFPDGTSGVATITISTAAGAVIGTEKVTFYGAIAKIVPTVVLPVIGSTGTGAITAIAYDAADVVVSAGNLFLKSDAPTIIAADYASQAIDATTGKASWTLTGSAAGTANFVVTDANTAATIKVTSASVAVRVGGDKTKLDGLKVEFDKSSYAPGELATITVTPTDAAGLTLADDSHTVFTSAGIVASYTVTGNTITTAIAHDGGVAGTGTKKGVATYKIYMPVTEGDVKFSWTRSAEYVTAANDDLTGSVTVSVSSPSTAAATDAANEATDAANAATDAALAAAEAADAATSAAQEASDAVAALSESVTKLIAGLQAQIKSLAAVVAKIAKKVKA